MSNRVFPIDHVIAGKPKFIRNRKPGMCWIQSLFFRYQLVLPSNPC